MIQFTILLISLIVIVYSVKTLLDTSRLVKIDTLMMLSVFAFILPQFYILISNKHNQSDAIGFFGFIVLFYISFICLFYKLVNPIKIDNIPSINMNTLSIYSFFTSLIGLALYLLISRQSEDTVSTTMMSGLPAFLVTFSAIIPISLTFSLYSRNSIKNIYNLIPILIGLFYFFDRIFIGGRRSAVVELFTILITFKFFTKRFKLPRIVFLLSIPTGFLILFSIAEYRNINLNNSGFRSFTDGARLPSINDIELVMNNANSITGNINTDEVISASIITYSTYLTSEYDFGAFNWNMLIHAWIPAFILGQDTKSNLKIDVSKPEEKLYSWKKNEWVAITGFTDSYVSFGLFGIVKFAIILLVMKTLYHLALNNNYLSMIIYTSLLISAMHTIPHHTGIFLNRVILLVIILTPFLIINSKARKST